MSAILYDYAGGIITSCKINLFITNVYKNNKLFSLITKIIKYNLLLHFLLTIVAQIIFYFIGVSFPKLINVLGYPLNIFSALFHLLHYMDLINIVITYSSKNSSTIPVLELVSLAFTMSIYQIVIYLTTNLINILLHDRLYYIAIFINFIILTIYHSFYCYNNLWQYKKIEMIYRIDMHEKLWPYYFGYGTIATIIYQYTTNPLILGFYNMYMVLLISLPFMVQPKYPSKTNNYPSYPAINLTIFSYITGCIFWLSRYITRTTKNSN